jgi:hypothetical protein
LFLAGGLSRLPAQQITRARCPDDGLVSIEDELRAAGRYFRLAQEKVVPIWPLLLVMLCLPGGLLFVLCAILRG